MPTPIPDMSDIQAVIFDMNGTIINDGAYHHTAWIEFARRHGIALTEEEYQQKKMGHTANRDILPLLFGKPFTPEEIDELAFEKEKIYRDLYREYLGEVTGFRALLDHLREKGFKVALATSSPKENLDFVLDGLDLWNSFDFIMHGDEVQNAKPDPEIFLTTAEKLGVSPANCLVFEDSPSGIDAALAAGMRVIGMLTLRTAEEIPGAESYIHDFTEMSIP